MQINVALAAAGARDGEGLAIVAIASTIRQEAIMLGMGISSSVLPIPEKYPRLVGFVECVRKSVIRVPGPQVDAWKAGLGLPHVLQQLYPKAYNQLNIRNINDVYVLLPANHGEDQFIFDISPAFSHPPSNLIPYRLPSNGRTPVLLVAGLILAAVSITAECE